MDPSRVRVIAGTDDFLVSRAAGDAVREARASDADVEIVDIEPADLTDVSLMQAVSPSLFGGSRFVVIRQGRSVGEAAAKALLAVAADPPEGVRILVTDASAPRSAAGAAGGADPASGGGSGTAGGGGSGPGGGDSGAAGSRSSASATARRLVSTLVAAGAEVTTCDGPRNARDRVGFVRDEVARCGGSITADGAAVLVDVVGSDTRELASAAGQLVADLSEPGRRLTLQASDVERFHRGRAEVTGFAIADLALGGDLTGALEMVRRAAVLGVHPLLVADALASGVRTLARVAGASQGRPLSTGDMERVGRELKVPGWKVKRLVGVSQDWSVSGLVAAARTTAELNTALKGSGTIADDQYSLEIAVRDIVSARGRRR